jgi:hypothetical protein
MAPLLQELSSLEAELLEIVPSQNRSLETLIGVQGESNDPVLLIHEGNFPINLDNCCCHCYCSCSPGGDIRCGCGIG